MRWLPSLPLLVVLLAAPPAAAQEPQQPLAGRHHHFKVDGGLWSAVGLAGLTYGYSPVREIEIEGGVGFGLSGIQLSLMPRLALGSLNNRFLVGVGLAVAIPVGDHFFATETTGLWLNLDAAGYEHRFDSGFAIQLVVGATIGLAGGEFYTICYTGCSNDQNRVATEAIAGIFWPQFRFGLGYYF